MEKVLVIGYVWPEPDSSAAGRHMLSLLQLFRQQGWQLEFATPAQESLHRADLSAYGISSQSINLNCDSFDHYIKAYAPDIVLFDRFMMEEQFGWRVEKNCPDALKILDTEDLQCLRHARHEAYKIGRPLSQADLFSDIAKREVAAILRCDVSLIISSFEMELLTDTFRIDSGLLHYLPFMIDLTSVPETTRSFSERQHFMSMGNFRHAPNWDVVLQLQKIWPSIRKKLPDAELHIYGAYPPPKATALNNPQTGFLIKGWAEDALAVMQDARICLAPLMFGAGIKGKLVDAMIAQTPSITTSIGAEGMAEKEHWPGAVIDEPEKFVEKAVELYSDQQQWQHAQACCSAIVRDNFDAARLGAELIDRIKMIKQQLPQHRLNNFTGAMLKHHTMMSTKYMSQWIAAKNKRTRD